MVAVVYLGWPVREVDAPARPAAELHHVTDVPGREMTQDLAGRLTGQVCAVTGATGIAAATARRLAAEGAVAAHRVDRRGRRP